MNPLLFLSRLCGQVPFSPLQNCSVCKALASSSAFSKDNEQTASEWMFESFKLQTENMASYVYGKSSWLVLPMIARLQESMFTPMSVKAGSLNIKAPTLSVGSKAKCDAISRRKTRNGEYRMNKTRRITSNVSSHVAPVKIPQPELVEEPTIHPSVPSAFPKLYGRHSPASDIVIPIETTSAPTLKRVDSKEWIGEFKNKRERIDKINFNNIFGGVNDVYSNEIPSLPPMNESPKYSPQPDPITSHTTVPSSPSSTSTNGSNLTTLSTNDVICGRGGLANSHPGNISFRQYALHLRSWYESSSKSEKYTISNMLVDYVKERGGRFLKRGEVKGEWLECDSGDVRRKASQALREGKLKDVNGG